MYVFSLHVYHMHAWCPQRQEKDYYSHWTGVTDSCGMPGEFCELNPDPLQKQQVFLSIGPSLQPPDLLFLVVNSQQNVNTLVLGLMDVFFCTICSG